MQVITEVLVRCRISVWERLAMDKCVADFQTITGACERIFNTPIPLSLTRMTSRILTLWHLGLPFGLWSFCGWLTIPITFISATGFFYIEEVGVMIEEPFWVLALSALSDAMKAAVEGLEVAHKKASAWYDTLDDVATTTAAVHLQQQQQAAAHDHEAVVLANRLPCRHNSAAMADDQVAVSSSPSEAVSSNSVDESINSPSFWGSPLPQAPRPCTCPQPHEITWRLAL